MEGPGSNRKDTEGKGGSSEREEFGTKGRRKAKALNASGVNPFETSDRTLDEEQRWLLA